MCAVSCVLCALRRAALVDTQKTQRERVEMLVLTRGAPLLPRYPVLITVEHERALDCDYPAKGSGFGVCVAEEPCVRVVISRSRSL